MTRVIGTGFTQFGGASQEVQQEPPQMILLSICCEMTTIVAIATATAIQTTCVNNLSTATNVAIIRNVVNEMKATQSHRYHPHPGPTI